MCSQKDLRFPKRELGALQTWSWRVVISQTWYIGEDIFLGEGRGFLRTLQVMVCLDSVRHARVLWLNSSMSCALFFDWRRARNFTTS